MFVTIVSFRSLTPLLLFMACLFPFFVNDVPVPCGKCPKCRMRKSNEWAFRILKESELSDGTMWITLTYDNDHLNVTPNGLLTLSKRDVQLFFKRLRKLHPKTNKPIKYYLCGEYGSRFHRPHYHVILLNVLECHLASAWRDSDGCPLGDIYIDDRPLTREAIQYTTGYMNKHRQCGFRKGDDRQVEFSLMSKGMGLSYLTPQMIDYHLADYSRNYVTLPDGIKSVLPRYYADRIYNAFDVAERLPIKELREATLDDSTRKSHQAVYDAYVRVHGNADGFIREQGERRKAAVLNFQNKSNSRKDV